MILNDALSLAGLEAFISAGPGECGDEIAMEQPSNLTMRLSIAVLDDTARLWRLLAVLTEHGVSPSQCTLWGGAGVLDDLKVPDTLAEPIRSDLAALLADADGGVVLGSGVELAVRSGASFDRLLRVSEGQELHWMHGELRRKLADQAARGGVVLLVNSNSSDQHTLAARLLLSHGSHDLHTHEFTLRDHP